MLMIKRELEKDPRLCSVVVVDWALTLLSTDADDKAWVGEGPSAVHWVVGSFSAQVQVKKHQQTTTTQETTREEALHAVSTATDWEQGTAQTLSVWSSHTVRLGSHWYKCESEYEFLCTGQQALHYIVNIVTLRECYVTCAIIMT